MYNMFRDKDSENVLHALMPGARIQKGTKKITVNMGTSNTTVIFNIGGTRFETYRSTLHMLPFSPLADDQFLKKHYREDKDDYFFDREPDVFKAILNYLRTGELHLPAWLCGASVRHELAFWGVQDDEIEECCWTNYNSCSSTLEALKKLEKDRKGILGRPKESKKEPRTKWKKFCETGWVVMNNPRSSKLAKIFGTISILFVFLAIFSFCAETHESFHMTVPAENEGVKTDIFENISVIDIKNETKYRQPENKTESPEFDVKIHPSLFIIDVICLTYFLLEFLTNFTFFPHKCLFFVQPMILVDICALIPDIVEIGYRIATNNLYSRHDGLLFPVLRITRIFRIMRLMRYIPGLWILFYTLKASLKELVLMFLFLLVGMLLYASLIYFADDRDTFSSIPQGFWWALITMTTVGYGDMFPVTKLGYLIGSFTAVSGLLMIGFTVPILVNNFVMFYTHTSSAMEREKMRAKKQKIAEQELQKRNKKIFKKSLENNGKEEIGMLKLESMAGDVSKRRTALKPNLDRVISESGSETALLRADSNGNTTGAYV